MSATSLDTHRIVKRLREAGVSDAQAETVTDVVRETRELDLSTLATKTDLFATKVELKAEISEVRAEIAEVRSEITQVKAEVGELRTEMRAEFKAVRSELQAEIANIRGGLKAYITEAKNDTLKWVVGLVLVQGGIVVTLMRLLPFLGH